MSLISTSYYSKPGTTSEKSVDEIATLISIITSGVESICTPWNMLSFYSALVDKYRNARYLMIVRDAKYDGCGRVVRGKIWE